MSKRVIKKKSELPTWFTLEKYQATANFSLSDWLNAFKFRNHLLFLLQILMQYEENPVANRIMQEDEKGLFNIKHLISLIERDGANAHKESDRGDYTNYKRLIVSSLSVHDFFTIQNSLETTDSGESSIYKKAYDTLAKEPKHGNRNIRIVTVPSTLAENAHDAMHPYRHYFHRVAFAQIDLSASDSTIKENFAKWLKEIRRSHKHFTEGRERRFSEKDANKWHRAGILQFLDLTIWSARESIEIPDWLMGEAIFGLDREINVGEAVRATTAPLAKRIWSEDLIQSLEAELVGRTEIHSTKQAKK